MDLCEVSCRRMVRIESRNRFHGKQIAKLKVKIREFYAGITLKRNHLFFLHFFTNHCESQRLNMIIFCEPQAQILAQKTGFAPKFSLDIRSAAWELFTGPHQSLPEMSDGPTAIGEHCLRVAPCNHRAGLWKYHAWLARPGPISFRTSWKFYFTCPWTSAKFV